MNKVNEILIDHFEMSLNGDDTNDDIRSCLLDAIAIIESGIFNIPVELDSVMDIHAFIFDNLNVDLNLDDVELFGKILKSLK